MYNRTHSRPNSITDNHTNCRTNRSTNCTTELIPNFEYGCTHSCSDSGTHSIDSIDVGFCIQRH
jgi:hypothetical protein